MTRHIIYFGIRDFAVAVERVRDKRLRERPVVMIPSAGARAVIAASSPEARAEGVREGMPLTVARRYCPKLQILLPDPALYRRAMTKVVGLLAHYSPLVEDTNDDLQLDAAVFVLAEKLGTHLRTLGKVAKNLRLTARFSDGRDFSRSIKLAQPSNLDLDLAAALREPAGKLFDRRVRVRYLRLNATRFDEEDLQRSLFGDPPERERLRALHRTLDRLRAKYGDEAVT